MHPEVSAWVASCAEMIDWDGALVYEVGALNVNGRARDSAPNTWREWVGFDLVAGEDVDVVGDASVLLAGRPLCDVLVSTEVLEHAPNWPELVVAMCAALASDGWLIVTCAGTGRHPHAADGSPNGPHPGEHYRNVDLAELAAVATAAGVEMVRGEEGYPGDTRFLGRKVR